MGNVVFIATPGCRGHAHLANLLQDAEQLRVLSTFADVVGLINDHQARSVTTSRGIKGASESRARYPVQIVRAFVPC